jgi:hypothetical protein
MLYDPTEHLPAKLSDEVLSRIRHLQEIEEQDQYNKFSNGKE